MEPLAIIFYTVTVARTQEHSARNPDIVCMSETREEHMGRFRSTKTYTHEVGLSSCFRQWRAESHCRLLHGYALSFKFTFEATELDERNWVVDFGSLKSLKGLLEDAFDHKLVVAEDDPKIEDLLNLGTLGLADVRVLPRVGCEAFAEAVAMVTQIWLADNGYGKRVKLLSVECCEHGANSAIYVLDDSDAVN